MITFKEACQRAGHTPKGILHVGASMLEEAEQYTEMGVKTVWWIEARPHEEARMAQAKKYGHVLLEGIALGSSNGLVTIHVTSNYVSSSVLPLERHAVIYPDIVEIDRVQVPKMRGDELLANDLPLEIDTLVIDTQGYEYEVVKGLEGLLSQINFVWAEVSLTELYSGQMLKQQFDDLMLLEEGFTRTEFHEVHQGEWGESWFSR